MGMLRHGVVVPFGGARCALATRPATASRRRRWRSPATARRPSRCEADRAEPTGRRGADGSCTSDRQPSSPRPRRTMPVAFASDHRPAQPTPMRTLLRPIVKSGHSVTALHRNAAVLLGCRANGRCLFVGGAGGPFADTRAGAGFASVAGLSDGPCGRPSIEG